MAGLPAGFVAVDPTRNQGQGPRRATNLPEGFSAREVDEAPASRGPILDTLDTFNDTLTFGLWPRAMEALGISPGAVERVDQVREENPVASIVGDMAGYAIPGAGISSAIGRAAPALANNTFRAVAGREALAGGTLSAADQVVRGVADGNLGETLDPTAIAIDSILSGGLAGGIQLGSLVNPTGRLRAAGSTLTDADRAAAENFSETAFGLGIPVGNLEALRQVPGARYSNVEGAYNSSVGQPGGVAAASEFDQMRSPVIRETGQELVDMLGGGVAPQDVTRSSNQVFDDIRTAANAQADPYYAAADARRIPPTWMPQHPYIDDAMQRLTEGEGAVGRMADLNANYLRTTGRTGPMPPNSFIYLDAVRREIQREIGEEAAKASPRQSYIEGLQAQLERLTNTMDTVSPDYATGRGIFENAMRQSENLEQTPLGNLRTPATAQTQASSVFGVTTGADADNSIAAMGQLANVDPDIPRGILANAIDSGTSSSVSNPNQFGTNLFPTDHSMEVMESTLGNSPAAGVVRDTVEAARAVRPMQSRNDAQLSGLSPSSLVFSGLLNAGTDRAVRNMNDPAFIEQLGRLGPSASRMLEEFTGAVTPGLDGNIVLPSLTQSSIATGRSAVATGDEDEWLSQYLQYLANRPQVALPR